MGGETRLPSEPVVPRKGDTVLWRGEAVTVLWYEHPYAYFRRDVHTDRDLYRARLSEIGPYLSPLRRDYTRADQASPAEIVREALAKSDARIGANPKHAAGSVKPGMHCIPPSMMMWLGYVMQTGADKYGAFNWGQSAVVWSVYYDAIQRHLNAIQAGETNDPESGAPHLAHIAACCAVALDAYLQGKLVDDRPVGRTAPLGGVMDEIKALMAKRRAGEKPAPHPLAGEAVEMHTTGTLPAADKVLFNS